MNSQKFTAVVEKLPLPPSFDLADLHRLNPERYPFLLASTAKGNLGEFDILFALPKDVLQLTDLARADEFIAKFSAQYQQLSQLISEQTSKLGLPFIGGWLMLFGYEYAAVIEPDLNLHQPELPRAFSAFCPAALIIDHKNQQLNLVAENQAQLDLLLADYAALLQAKSDNQIWLQQATTKNLSIDWQVEEGEIFTQAVEIIQSKIAQGEIVQANVSRKWQAKTQAQPLEIYQQLKIHNPAPFACLLNFPETEQSPAWSVISSSPERLLRYKNSWLETRPIGGTRKRSADPVRDLELLAELKASVKEQSEHQMLIDLEIEDLAKVCSVDSIEVNEKMVAETYQHVHHLVSNVRGKLQPDLVVDGVLQKPLDVIHAMFPGGSITGDPKIATINLVTELETSAREAYTGSVGYINYDGTMDFNILIRSFIWQKTSDENQLSFRTGAGIIAAANPQQELKETYNKAKGLLKVFDETI